VLPIHSLCANDLDARLDSIYCDLPLEPACTCVCIALMNVTAGVQWSPVACDTSGSSRDGSSERFAAQTVCRSGSFAGAFGIQVTKLLPVQARQTGLSHTGRTSRLSKLRVGAVQVHSRVRVSAPCCLEAAAGVSRGSCHLSTAHTQAAQHPAVKLCDVARVGPPESDSQRLTSPSN
jgi:hypothetical protein